MLARQTARSLCGVHGVSALRYVVLEKAPVHEQSPTLLDSVALLALLCWTTCLATLTHAQSTVKCLSGELGEPAQNRVPVASRLRLEV